MIETVFNRVQRALRDEQGIETLEWIAMACVIIILVAVVAYPSGLVSGIQSAIQHVVDAVTAI